MQVHCPNCGAGVKFEPSIQKCFCEYCGNEIEVDNFKLDDFYEFEEGQSSIYDECICSACGAKLIADRNTTVTKCIYCGGTQIIKERLKGVFKPEAIIPFKISKGEFISKYRTFISKKILAPKAFKNNEILEDIKGMYVPFYLYEYQTTTYARGMAIQKTKKRTYYKYFETEYEMEMMSPQDASKMLDDKVMTTLEPFEFSELVDFKPTYLTGFISERTDQEECELRMKSRDRVLQETEKVLDDKISPYFFSGGKIDTNLNIVSKKYILLPVWFFNSIYKGKIYSYALNAQTGKIVGQIPLSKPKFFSILILMFLIIVFCSLIGYDGTLAGIAALGSLIVCITISVRYTNVNSVNSNRLTILKNDEKVFKKYFKEEYIEKFGNDELKKIVIKKHTT